MDDEERIGKSDLFKRPSDDELNLLSADELAYRVGWLEDEIARTRDILKAKEGALSDAEAVFKN